MFGQLAELSSPPLEQGHGMTCSEVGQSLPRAARSILIVWVLFFYSVFSLWQCKQVKKKQVSGVSFHLYLPALLLTHYYTIRHLKVLTIYIK